MKLSVHPQPQFERERFELLNGKWDFGFKKSGRRFAFSTDFERALSVRADGEYPYRINVPFCIESELSGIGYTGFL